MNHFESQGNLAINLGEAEALQVYLDRFEDFSGYHRWLYFQARLDAAFIPALLEANDRNELEYYALYYAERPVDAQDAEAVKGLIENYSSLLSQNEHLTVLSQNPKYAQELCGLYPAELEETCAVFEWIWSLEVYKFNQRYGTELVGP